MTSTTTDRSQGRAPGAEIRSRLGHPVIDADGHWVEYAPGAARRHGPHRRRGGGPGLRLVLRRGRAVPGHERRPSGATTTSPRRRSGARPPATPGTGPPRCCPGCSTSGSTSWASTSRCSTRPPGLGAVRVADDGDRRATCRAFNTYSAETFAPFADRMTPAAVIPMHTPDEALAELDHAVGELGPQGGHAAAASWPARSATWRTSIRRWPAASAGSTRSASTAPTTTTRCGPAASSSAWRPRSTPAAAATACGPRRRTSCYNHIGHFAAASEAVCKALFLGGVTRRFPALRVAFLEGGVGWACQLLADLVGHWEKRNLEALEATRPDNLRVDELVALAASLRRRGHGRGDRGPGRADGRAPHGPRRRRRPTSTTSPPAGSSGPEDVVGLFVDNFYFGCEADDRMNAWAFDRATTPSAASSRRSSAPTSATSTCWTWPRCWPRPTSWSRTG